jgi:Leucine-rich repeat (LRR) protein
MLPSLVPVPSPDIAVKRKVSSRKSSKKLDSIGARPEPKQSRGVGPAAEKKAREYVADARTQIFARDSCGVRTSGGIRLRFASEDNPAETVDALDEINDVLWGVESRFSDRRPVRVFFGGKSGGEQLTWVEGRIATKCGIESETNERQYRVDFDFDEVAGTIVDQNVQTMFQTWLKTKSDSFSHPMLLDPMVIALRLPGQHKSRAFIGTVRPGVTTGSNAMQRMLKISFTEPVSRMKFHEGLHQNFSGVVTIEVTTKAELEGRELPVLTLHKTEIPISEKMLSPQPILIVGPPGSGKTTLLTQYALQICEQQNVKNSMIPVLIPAAELASIMRSQKLGPDVDVLKLYFKQSCNAHYKVLMQLRGFHRLVVLLDGLDEGGEVMEALERYVSMRLSVEVMLIATTRGKGLKTKRLFKFFAHRRLPSLDQKQLRQLVDSDRGFGSAALAQYIEQQQQKDGFTRMLTSPSNTISATSYAAMATTPLMFQLMALDYMGCTGRGEKFVPPSTVAEVYLRGVDQILQTEAAAHMTVCFEIGDNAGTAGRFLKYSEQMVDGMEYEIVANRTGKTAGYCGAELARGRGSGGCFSRDYLDLIYEFMAHLAYALHTRSSTTFRLFDVGFLVEHLFAKDTGLDKRDEYRRLWENCILPMARHGDGRFPLITLILRAPPPTQGKKSSKRRKGKPANNNAEEPEGLEFFQISHLSFQEYFCALHTVRMSRLDKQFAKKFAKTIQPVGVFKFETVLESERYCLVMQFCRELLQADDPDSRNRFAACFLPAAMQSSRGVTIEGGLNTIETSASLFGLISFLQQDTPVNLAASELNLDALLGWRDCLCPWRSLINVSPASGASNKGNGNDLKINALNLVGCRIDGQGAKVLATILKECSSLSKMQFSGDMEAGKKPVMVETFRNVLSFKGKRMGLPAAHVLSSLISKIPTLRELDLSNNNLGELELPPGWTKDTIRGTGFVPSSDGNPLEPPQTVVDNALSPLQTGENPLAPPLSSSSVVYRHMNGALQVSLPEGSAATGIIALAAALGKHPTLQSVDLRRNNIGDDALAAMLDGLDKSRSIVTFSCIPIRELQENHVRTIKLCSNDLGNNEAAVIAHYMENNSSLRSLDLSKNLITATGAVHLGAAFGSHQGLVKCDMTGNNIGREGTEAVFRALGQKGSTLSVFNGIPFRRMKKNDSDYHTLDLRNKSLSHEAGLLAYAIQESGCSALKSILLSSNEVMMAPVGAAFAELLKVNMTLTTLDLAGNANFHSADGPGFAKAIASGLAKNSTLTELNIAHNNLTKNGRNLEGLTAFCKGLKENKGLSSLTFSGDWSLSQAVTVDITSVTEAYFSEEYLGQAGGEILAVLLPKCKTLKGCEICDDRIPNGTVGKMRTLSGLFSFDFAYSGGDQLFSANYSEE